MVNKAVLRRTRSDVGIDVNRALRKSVLADFRADVARYVYYDDPVVNLTRLRVMRALVAHQGLQAVALYRMARFLRCGRPRGVLALVIFFVGRLAYPILSRLNDIANGIWICPVAEIGPGLFIAHYGGVIIGPAKIGSNCNVGNNVTIGKGGRGDRAGRPVIGDRVIVAVGARVLGRITVGDDAMVGANSVVNRNVLARAVVTGVPALQISLKGSFDYLDYPGIEMDHNRAKSLAAL